MEWKSRKESTNVDDRRLSSVEGSFFDKWKSDGYKRNEEIKNNFLSSFKAVKELFQVEKSAIKKPQVTLLEEVKWMNNEKKVINLINELKENEKKFPNSDLLWRNKISAETDYWGKTKEQYEQDLVYDTLSDLFGKKVPIKKSWIKKTKTTDINES